MNVYISEKSWTNITITERDIIKKIIKFATLDR